MSFCAVSNSFASQTASNEFNIVEKMDSKIIIIPGFSWVDLTIRCMNQANATAAVLNSYGIGDVMTDNGLTNAQNMYIATYEGCMKSLIK